MDNDKDDVPRKAPPNYWLSAELSENIKAEGDAMEKYQRLLGRLDPRTDKVAIEIIEDNLAEEKAHLIKLQYLVKLYDDVCPDKESLEDFKAQKLADDLFSKRKKDRD